MKGGSTSHGGDGHLQYSKHFHDGAQAIDGVVTLGGADIEFKNPVLISIPAGGGVRLALDGDRKDTPGTLYTFEEGTQWEGRVRKIFAAGTDATEIIAYL